MSMALRKKSPVIVPTDSLTGLHYLTSTVSSGWPRGAVPGRAHEPSVFGCLLTQCPAPGSTIPPSGFISDATSYSYPHSEYFAIACGTPSPLLLFLRHLSSRHSALYWSWPPTSQPPDSSYRDGLIVPVGSLHWACIHPVLTQCLLNNWTHEAWTNNGFL